MVYHGFMSNQAERNKEAFDFNEVIENVHLAEIAAASNVGELLAGKLGIDASLIDSGAWSILGHSDSGVTLLYCYDYVALDEQADR